MKPGKRSWAPRELRLVAEFLAATYPKYPYKMRVRLGTTHPHLVIPEATEEENKLIGSWRRWADAIVFADDRLILIEVAIVPEPGDISMLLLYERLIPHTPELEEYSNLPVEKLLVYAIEDPVLISLARDQGIKVIYFKPDWVDEYLPMLFPRERRAPLTYPIIKK